MAANKKAEYDKKYREKNKETYSIRQRNKKLRAKYNLSFDQYLEMCVQQQNCCAICKQEETTRTSQGDIRPLAVDHCHTTGKVRGLLCNSCNAMLGFAKDNINTLSMAINYLDQSKE